MTKNDEGWRSALNLILLMASIKREVRTGPQICYHPAFVREGGR